MPERYNDKFWNYVDRLVDESEVVVDRPQYSHHPRFHSVVYPLDYGYLAGTTTSDGGGIDVWIGTASGQNHRVNGVLGTVDMKKRDAEIKILINCTEAEMITIAEFVNANEMGCLLLRRPKD